MSASIREELEREAATVRERIRTRVEELDRRSPPAQKDDLETPERKELEQRADEVRERLADNLETLEKEARERLLPIVVAGGALMLFFTVGFAWMFYKTMKLSR